jgi:hypothetical protein
MRWPLSLLGRLLRLLGETWVRIMRIRCQGMCIIHRDIRQSSEVGHHLDRSRTLILERVCKSRSGEKDEWEERQQMATTEQTMSVRPEKATKAQKSPVKLGTQREKENGRKKEKKRLEAWSRWRQRMKRPNTQPQVHGYLELFEVSSRVVLEGSTDFLGVFPRPLSLILETPAGFFLSPLLYPGFTRPLADSGPATALSPQVAILVIYLFSTIYFVTPFGPIANLNLVVAILSVQVPSHIVVFFSIRP